MYQKTSSVRILGYLGSWSKNTNLLSFSYRIQQLYRMPYEVSKAWINIWSLICPCYYLAFPYSSALFNNVIQAKLHFYSTEASCSCCIGELWSCKDILIEILQHSIKARKRLIKTLHLRWKVTDTKRESKSGKLLFNILFDLCMNPPFNLLKLEKGGQGRNFYEKNGFTAN